MFQVDSDILLPFMGTHNVPGILPDALCLNCQLPCEVAALLSQMKEAKLGEVCGRA